MRWNRDKTKRNVGQTESQRQDSLVQECERFLNGTYASALQAEGRNVPQWAWLNTLAHAPRPVLEQMASRSRQKQPQSPTQSKWEEAAAVIAKEMIAKSDDLGRDVVDLQRMAILGIEISPDLTGVAEMLKDPDDLLREVISNLNIAQDNQSS